MGKVAGGLAAGVAVTELSSKLLQAGFAAYMEKRAAGLMSKDPNSRGEAWAAAGNAVKANICSAALDVAWSFCPYVTSYQDIKAGHYWAAAGWAALDTVGLAAFILGPLAAPIEGGIGALKIARGAGKAVMAGSALYVGGQAAWRAEKFREYLNTPEGRYLAELARKELLTRKGITAADLLHPHTPSTPASAVRLSGTPETVPAPGSGNTSGRAAPAGPPKERNRLSFRRPDMIPDVVAAPAPAPQVARTATVAGIDLDSL